jgi:DNA-binding LytR/AlgR family response regulator
VLVLIPLSCALAGIPLGGVQIGDPDMASQFANDGLLVAFVIAGFTGLAHAHWFLQRRKSRERSPAAAYLEQVTVRSRGGVVLLPLDDIDWIETQGNYLALHAGAATHLIRETSASFQAQLDPDRFIRIHRRTIVALDRVRALAPLGGGDAELTLGDGTKLRLSRSFREPVQARLESTAAGR